MKKLGRTIKWIIFKINIFIFLLRNYEPWIYTSKELAIKRAKKFEKRIKAKIYVIEHRDYSYELMAEAQFLTHEKLILNDPIYKDLINDKVVYNGKE